MPSHVLYIDDSGTKEYADRPERYDATGNSRYFVFGGVLLTTDESGRMVERIRTAKKRYFGTDSVEIKSNWLRIPKEREKRYLTYYGLSSDQLRQFVEEYYEIIASSDLKLVAAVIDKVHVQEKYPAPWYAPAIAYELLIQRVVTELTEPNCVSVVIDDMTGATPAGNQYKENLKKHHARLKQFGSRLHGTIHCGALAGDIKFLNSALSHPIQVADVVAYNIYRQFKDHGDACESLTVDTLPTYEWFARLGHKFRMGPGKRIQGYGIVKFPLNRRVMWYVRDEEKGEAAP